MEKYVKQYKEDGFTVIPDFFSAEEVAELKREYIKLVDEMNPAEHRAVFTTTDEQVKDRGDYFIESGDKIRFFFEKDVFDEKGELKIEKHAALNKVGHALHAYSELCKRVTFDRRIAELCRLAGFRAPAVCQSMYILKQPKVGGEVSTHQDATFLYTEPSKDTLIGFWLALDDCSSDNGCLHFVPGSHQHGLINGRRMIRVFPGETTPASNDQKSDMVQMAPTGNDASDNDQLRLAFIGGATTSEGEFVPVPCRAGSLVLIHGLVVHRSEANHSKFPRNSYAFHVIETNECEWNARNWLQPTEKLGFVRFY